MGLAFVPRDFLQGLFRVYGMDLPAELTSLQLGNQDVADPTLEAALLSVDHSTLSYIGELLIDPWHS